MDAASVGHVPESVTPEPDHAEVRTALAAVDLGALRTGRLARLQRSMVEHDVDACLFFKPANVRYATGTSVMTVYCLDNFVRCALVPASGEPILYEHPEYTHVTSRIVRDVRADAHLGVHGRRAGRGARAGPTRCSRGSATWDR